MPTRHRHLQPQDAEVGGAGPLPQLGIGAPSDSARPAGAADRSGSPMRLPANDQAPSSAGLHISLDGSALFGPADGIGRYVRSLLPRLVALAPDEWRWSVFGRRNPAPPLNDLPRVEWKRDGLPAGAGRVLSLLSSQPWWLHRTAPHLHFGPAHRLPVALPAPTARVVTIHDLCWLRAPATMRPATRVLDTQLMPRALRMADRIIAVSRSTEQDLAEAFPDIAKRVVVIHEAAEPLPQAQSVEALAGWGIAQPYVLAVGSIEPRKNLQRLVEAFAALPEALRSRTQLVIAGAPGWGDVDLPRVASALGVGGQLRLLGRVDDAALATLYRHARLLAMPSLYEGFGLPVLEALAQGTPVLVAKGSSLPEVAGDAGLCVDPLDVPAISSGIRQLLEDDGLHARLASEALQQAARFSWERAARETLRVFVDAMERRLRLTGHDAE